MRTSAYLALVLEPFTESFNRISKLRKSFFIALILALSFILINSFVSSSYQSRLLDYVLAIGTVALSATGVKGNSSPSFADIFINPSTSGYLISFVILLVLFSVSIYYLFCFFVGMISYITVNISSNSQPTKSEMVPYLGNFFRINIPWFIIIFIESIISMYFYYLDTVNVRLGNASSNYIYFHLAFVLILTYFMLISFNLERKNNFRSSIIGGLVKIFYLFPYYLIILYVILLLYLFQLFVRINFILSIIYEAIVVLGSIIFFMVVFSYVCNKFIKHKNNH
jgi:hypothetical protein